MNTPYSERAEKFGDTLLGLHYDSDFLKELHKQGISTSFEGALNTKQMTRVHPDCFTVKMDFSYLIMGTTLLKP